MAFKMKGAPLMDTSKKHGTNKNFMKSGMKNADGSAAAGAPFLGGIIGKIKKNPLDPLGLFGKGKGKGGACPPGQMQPPAPRPAEPTGTPAPAAAAPAPAPAAEEAQPAATMKKGLMKGGAPMANPNVKDLRKKVRKDRIMDAKPPNYKKPKKRTIMDPVEKVDPKYRIGGGVKPRDKSIKRGAPKLKGGQHKIDMNKDGKLSKADFDMMNKKGAPMAKKGGPKMMAKKKGAPMAKKKGAPLKSDTLRKADQKVKDMGDKYSKSKIGKFMGKADKFMSNLDPVRNIREAFTKKKKK